jgi:hypothetical protein
MRRISWLCATVLVLAASGAIRTQARQQDQTSSQTSQSSAPATAPDPLVEAARKAREQKKDAPKAAKVFTNDDIPTQAPVSTGDDTSAQGTTDTSTAAAPSGSEEKTWRDKFAALHQKLDQDQSELDVLQREAGVSMVQYYGGDPQKAAQDQMSQKPLGAAYDKKVSAIDEKKKQVEADQQAISDAEDALHKAGGDPGWAR